MVPGGRARLGFCLALVFGCLIEAAVKTLDNSYPITQLLFFRMAFSLPIVLPALPLRALPRANLRRQGARALIQLTGLGCWFLALPHLPLADATALSFTAPLFILVLSILVLGEKVPAATWVALPLGMAGVLAIAPPTGQAGWAGLLVLASAALRALSVVQTRTLTQSDGVGVTVLAFTLTGIAVTAVTLPWVWVPPRPEHWLLLAAIGVMGGISQLLSAWALGNAPASQLAPLDYLRLPVSGALSVVLFQDVPTPLALAGTAAIVAAALVSGRRPRIGAG